ncbi:MAG TPA: pyridoxamine 5'-phosphate oxidase family protein [Noviherbaspirillum sp.]
MQTNVPSWRDTLSAQLDRHAHLPYSRFVSAATVRADGRPANRTLTFRFFLPDGRLLFTTDTRTDKVVQLATNPWVEACWYFTDSRMQVRISGTMECVDGSGDEELQQARLRTWRERSEESRQSFTWPHAGQLLAAADAFAKAAPALPPENFALLILAPQQVDILDLIPSPHSRIVYTLNGSEWQSAAINP